MTIFKRAFSPKNKKQQQNEQLVNGGIGYQKHNHFWY